MIIVVVTDRTFQIIPSTIIRGQILWAFIGYMWYGAMLLFRGDCSGVSEKVPVAMDIVFKSTGFICHLEHFRIQILVKRGIFIFSGFSEFAIGYFF